MSPVKKPTIILLGRPNVGKSTLFNHFTHKKSLVSPVPHTTRDRLYASLKLGEGEAVMVDVGGWVSDGVGILQCAQKQLEVAVQEGDIFLLIVDGKDGLTPMDVELADWARQQSKPTILVVNKVDTPNQYYLVNDFYKMGFSPVIGISAINRSGIGELR